MSVLWLLKPITLLGFLVAIKIVPSLKLNLRLKIALLILASAKVTSLDLNNHSCSNPQWTHSLSFAAPVLNISVI